MKPLRYFTQKDFDAPRCVPACKLSDMDPDFMAKLDEARHISGLEAQKYKLTCPYIINSAYRSPEWEKARGRSTTNSHPSRKAVDIRFTNNQQAALIVIGLVKAGLIRYGINWKSQFIHVDDALHLPHPTLFPYQ
jgi:uncharacterized protein YcbK (DUF882 family)